jgi:hypothetical protein
MQLTIESDASYLSVPKARSRAARYFYLSSRSKPILTGALHVHCHIMREVVSLAAEAELGALFHNSTEACPLQIALEELGHPQLPTAIITNDSTATGIANDTVKQLRLKAIGMRFYWIRDRICQGQYTVEWIKREPKFILLLHKTSSKTAPRTNSLYIPFQPF